MSIAEQDSISFSPEAFIPSVESAVFTASPEATFWLGITASSGEIMLPQEHTASRILRANVYIDENRFLPDDARRPDGTETDDDDVRATHFSVVENSATHGKFNLVGTSRLIHKHDHANPLPVERLFPEAFPEPAAVNSVEASRFIARYPDRFTQSAISLSLIRAKALHAHQNGLEPAYAVVEDHLTRLFDKIGLPFEQIADKKMIPEYQTENMAIRIQPSEIIKHVAADKLGEKILTMFFNSTVVDSAGLGHFDNTLLSPVPTRAA